ncbi:glucose/arabinose dehydrogenase [Nocardiopsis arvandica]|uniref:Glucose/arabinose dehydrogenase n=1 Tax=Nocardiopsis sinuspersici TaxID=501010 RepID=A0A7Y9XDW4_9ACTN|nr:PQQ-dependent sugar dehydrogenase [Nocardiopsis sinuspersici]NYH52990.1 glucose/arabinose dehydrogenase [Nocardiopsis sinuspersici]
MGPATNGTPAVRVAAVLGALVLVAGCGGQEGGTGGTEENGGGGYGSGSASATAVEPGEPEVVATGLEVPWGVAFLPDGSALVSQRDLAEIVRVSGDGAVTDVGTVEGVSPVGEGGLMGLALHPDFPDEPYLYAYHTSESDNRISRMEYDPGSGELGEAEVVLDGIPSSSHHDGGRIEFGPDGMLYVGTGDAGRSRLAQNIDSLAGKILRITPEGEPAPGNPFDNRVYSYGHRNVQGLAWDGEENLYATEFGADKLDEINLIEAGNNYGWPEVEGPGGGDEYVDPLVTWSPEEASPSGAAIAGGSLWVAALRGERLWEVPLTEDGLGEPVAHYQEEYGRLRTVATAPGGDGLWLTTSNLDALGNPVAEDDRILRVPLE